MDKERELQEELVWNAGYRMNESLRMIKICLDQLSEEQVWEKPNESSNSIANLILRVQRRAVLHQHPGGLRVSTACCEMERGASKSSDDIQSRPGLR